MLKKKINMVSLFSGIGAFEKALGNIGINYNLINYCEIDKYASASYSKIHNISEDKNLWDVTKINTDELKNIDLIVGGFPCQDISLAGKQAGIIKGETRSGLMYDMMKVIKEVRPKYVIAENVKNILSKKHLPQLEEYLCFLSDCGYSVTMDCLNAKNYGVPQNRERVYVIGIKGDNNE